MLQLDAARTICSIKEMLVKPISLWDLKRNEKNNFTTPGILFELDVWLSEYASDNKGKYCDASARQLMYFLITGTTVWVAYEKERKKPESSDFKFLSSHDTCWRDALDSEIFKTYMEVAKRINSQLVESGFPEVAPAMMKHHSAIGFIGDPWKMVDVTWDYDRENSYKRVLINFQAAAK